MGTEGRIRHTGAGVQGDGRRGTLYLTSFLGRGGKGPGGAVFTLGLNSRVLKPLLKRFVAPTVGLGLHHGYVYVGELTGQVYRVRI